MSWLSFEEEEEFASKANSLKSQISSIKQKQDGLNSPNLSPHQKDWAQIKQYGDQFKQLNESMQRLQEEKRRREKKAKEKAYGRAADA
jgi:hypothetical protein